MKQPQAPRHANDPSINYKTTVPVHILHTPTSTTTVPSISRNTEYISKVSKIDSELAAYYHPPIY